MSGNIIKKVKQHPLIDMLIHLKGNPKIAILVEPFWGIPFNLIAPFTTLYMYSLGVTDVQIGLILSISMVVQLFFSLMGGIITDKLGRKNTTIMGDFFGWTLACLIWAFSQNFWFFLAAVLMNSFEQINQTAWVCLLMEDSDKRHTVNIYTWVSIAGLMAVFFAPISGVLVAKFSLVPVVRVLYFIFAVSMIVKDIITWRHTTETRQGKIRRQETKGVSVGKMLLQYKTVIPNLLKNKATIQTLALMIFTYITAMISNNFFGLYVGETLDVKKEYLAFFPIIKAIVMIAFMFGLQHKITKIKRPLIIGLVIYIVAQSVLIVSPKGQIITIVVYIFMDAVANALVYPRKESMLILNVDEGERARIMALMTTLMIAFSAPFGYLTGLLSGIDRRLPFAFGILMFVLAIFVVSRSKEPEPEIQVEP
ncbi:MFS transporter [Scatolibacter rhodanostii]|uniref:MFS transporter n=1 Tax=Scatolibacter rhodanostii TaxID=2014781 RepID=UPI001FA932F2|nr:MFS transporter [Scatolibacter rhodanostii]